MAELKYLKHFSKAKDSNGRENKAVNRERQTDG